MSSTEDQDKRIEEQSNGDGLAEHEPHAEETQVGHTVQGLARATRQLAARQLPARPPAPVKRAVAQAANAALRERIANLVAALGDPSHPLHHQAVDDLVSIGGPAVPALNDA